ncbi:MAG: hypothetical protein Q4B77_00675 [Coriobacteriaceae bacterium]|nr:hypothetical protein [Coriobacteriaceae bacterium]
MKKKSSLVVLAALLSSAAFMLVTSAAIARNNPSIEPAIVKSSEDGSTYGYASPLDYGYEPDYIKAVASNGCEGYVKKTELLEAERMASSPGDAIRLTEERDNALRIAFTDKLKEVTGAERVDDNIASQLLTAALTNPGAPVSEIAALPLAQGLEQLTNDQLNTVLAEAMMSIGTSIPVYAEDGKTVIGEFIVG